MTRITSILLVVLCLLIYNVSRNKVNFGKYETLLENMYDDRIIAERIILDCSLILYKNLNILYDNHLSTIEKVEQFKGNSKLFSKLIDEFSLTWMTKEEKVLFERLSTENKNLLLDINNANLPSLHQDLNNIQSILGQLSTVQIEESNKILKESGSIIGSSTLLYQANWGLLIFLLMSMYYFIVSEILFRKIKINTSPNLN